MTTLLYQQDSYLRNCNTTICEIHPEGVILSETPLYPGGGGQPCDYGELAADGSTLKVTGVKRVGGKIVHLIDEAHSLSIGQKVSCTVDWDRRYKLMRTHTAMHILCGVIWRDYQAQVTGGNMEPCRGRMDFEFEKMNKDLIEEIEVKLNKEVNAKRQINVNTLSRQDAFKIPDLIRTKINLLPSNILEVRTVELVGLDLQADGGTHVANTEEVGPLRITDYKSKGKLNKRIILELLESN